MKSNLRFPILQRGAGRDRPWSSVHACCAFWLFPERFAIPTSATRCLYPFRRCSTIPALVHSWLQWLPVTFSALALYWVSTSLEFWSRNKLEARSLLHTVICIEEQVAWLWIAAVRLAPQIYNIWEHIKCWIPGQSWELTHLSCFVSRKSDRAYLYL